MILGRVCQRVGGLLYVGRCLMEEAFLLFGISRNLIQKRAGGRQEKTAAGNEVDAAHFHQVSAVLGILGGGKVALIYSLCAGLC